MFFGLNLNDLQTYPRARQRGDAWTTCSAWRATTCIPTADHRARRRRVGVRQAAAGRRLRQVRGHSRGRARPRRRRSAAQGRSPAAAAVSCRFRAGVRVTAEASMQSNSAKALLDKAIAAKGGLAKLKGIRTVRVGRHDDRHVDSRGPVPFAVVDIDRVSGSLPRRRRHARRQGRAGLRRRPLLDPGSARQASELPRSGARPDPGERAARHRSVLVKAAAGKLVRARRGLGRAGARRRSRSRGDGMRAAHAVHQPRQRPDRAGALRRDAGRPQSRRRYSDYRNVDGIQVPFHTVVRRAGLTSDRARRQDDPLQRPACRRALHVKPS